MYKVIVKFVDLKDNNHVYHVGDVFPHKKTKVIPEERINELKTSANKRGIPLIEEIPEAAPVAVQEEPVEIPEETSAIEEEQEEAADISDAVIAVEEEEESQEDETKIKEEPAPKKSSSKRK